MGTHPIFESDFDCLTECPTVSTVQIGIIKTEVKVILIRHSIHQLMPIKDMIKVMTNHNRIIQTCTMGICTHQIHQKARQLTCIPVALKMNPHYLKSLELILIIFIKKQLLL